MFVIPLALCPLASGDKVENGHLNLKVKLCLRTCLGVFDFDILMAFNKAVLEIQYIAFTVRKAQDF